MIEPVATIPVRWPLSEEEHRRLHHRDLAYLTAQDLWAEDELLRLALARRVLRHQRDRVLIADRGESFRPVAESSWLVERLQAIAAERRARRIAAGRRERKR